jgi:spore coat-associated protein N
MSVRWPSSSAARFLIMGTLMSRSSTAPDPESSPRPRDPATRRRGRRIAWLTVGFVLAGTLSTTAAYAVFSTSASTEVSVSTATLSLSLASNGTAFSQGIANMLPGDTITRFVDLSNDSTAGAASGLSLAVTPGTSNKLTNDQASGLQLTVNGCTLPWTASSATCGATQSTVVAQTPVATYTTQSLLTGALPAGQIEHLEVLLTLPAQSETTTNGAPPANSIQYLSNSLTFTFATVQRAPSAQ